MATIKIIGMADGEPTPFDGQYVVEYDPTRDGVDPNGDPVMCHLITTPDKEKALHLRPAEALEFWRKAHGLRADGKPNRPLSAFTVQIG